MESVNGLPAHVLLLHAPVVLMPLTALGALVVAARPGWRRRVGIGLVVAAVVVTVTTILAVRSGEAFAELLGDAIDTSEHEELAETTLMLVFAFLVGTVATVGADQWRRRNGPDWLDQAAAATMALTAVVALVATVWMARTGDEGATLVWDGVIPEETPGEG